MASPEQLPFFSKVEIQPSEVDTHILTPPKLMSKDGVFAFDRKKYYQRKVEPLTRNPFEEYVHQAVTTGILVSVSVFLKDTGTRKALPLGGDGKF